MSRSLWQPSQVNFWPLALATLTICFMTLLASARPPFAQALPVGVSGLVAMVHFPSSPARTTPAAPSAITAKNDRAAVSLAAERVMNTLLGWNGENEPAKAESL